MTVQLPEVMLAENEKRGFELLLGGTPRWGRHDDLFAEADELGVGTARPTVRSTLSRVSIDAVPELTIASGDGQ